MCSIIDNFLCNRGVSPQGAEKLKLNKLIVFLLFITPLLACEQEGPAEKAGAKIDEAVENVKDTADDTAEKLGEKAEELGDKIEKKTQ